MKFNGMVESEWEPFEMSTKLNKFVEEWRKIERIAEALTKMYKKRRKPYLFFFTRKEYVFREWTDHALLSLIHATHEDKIDSLDLAIFKFGMDNSDDILNMLDLSSSKGKIYLTPSQVKTYQKVIKLVGEIKLKNNKYLC